RSWNYFLASFSDRQQLDAAGHALWRLPPSPGGICPRFADRERCHAGQCAAVFLGATVAARVQTQLSAAALSDYSLYSKPNSFNCAIASCLLTWLSAGRARYSLYREIAMSFWPRRLYKVAVRR